jgi:CBS domain-containing membrane protein
MRRMAQRFRPYWPAPLGIDGRERVRVVVGVVFGVLMTALLSRWWLGHTHLHHAGAAWMVASVGASAVLIFGMPSSPLAQPWPVLAGSTLSALVGAVCAMGVPDPALAGALAVGLAFAIMVPLRCLHPPGGAMALYAVMNADTGFSVAWFPVLFNVAALLCVGVLYNWATGRRYPHPQGAKAGQANTDYASGRFTAQDVDAALAQYNQVLDVSRADLEGLLHLAGRAAFQRTLGDVRCMDVMSKPPFAVEPGAALKDAWSLMRAQQIKALPVIDDDQKVIGIVTTADFMRLAQLDVHEGLGQRLRNLVKGKESKPNSVADIMTTHVQLAHTQQHAMDLVALFSRGGHHHIPVVDTQERLVGIITQSDLIRVLATVITDVADAGAPHNRP